MQNNLTIDQFGERIICIAGIGKLFYQEGYPISMAVQTLKAKGIEVSLLHAADECLKNGWSAKTTFNKLNADFADDIDGNCIDEDLLYRFCYNSYEGQREMILQYLFGNINNAKLFVDKRLKSK